MNVNEIAERISNKGRFIVVIEYYNHRVALYSIDMDFYEIHYDESNHIDNAFQASNKYLAKFLNRITLKL